jgi:hypothetical protein
MVEIIEEEKAPIKVYSRNERGWSPTDLGTKIKA